MNKLNKKMEYALMGLRLIASKPIGQLTSAKEVADQMHISFEATARVLQQLSASGLLQAEYGVTGGYKIVKPLDQVSVHELNEMLEGAQAITRCLAKNEPCEISRTCNIVSPISNLNQKVQDFYKSLTLAEVLHV